MAPTRRLEEIGSGHRVLCVADFRQRHSRRQGAVVDLQVFEHLLDESNLIGGIIDDEIARQADSGRFATQQACAERVKRRNPGAGQRRPDQRFDARAHFFRGLVGEGDGENLVVLRVPLRQQVRDPLSDDASLAGSGAGEDQQRPVNVQDGVALFGIQACEWVHELADW